MRDSTPVPPSPSPPPPSGTSPTTAVVLATTAAASLRCGGGPDDDTLADRLTAQLGMLPVREVHVVGRSGAVVRAADGTHLIGTHGSAGPADDLRRIARVAREAAGPVAVLAGDVVAHTEALAVLLDHPARDTGAVVVAAEADGDGPGPLHPPVRVEGGRVVAVGVAGRRVAGANATFRGVLQIGGGDLAILAEVAEELAARAAGEGAGGPGGSGAGAEAGELLLAGLVHAGAAVRAAGPGRLHCDRVAGRIAAEAAVRRLTEVDEDRARLEAAVKSDDGFFTTYAVSSWSPHLVRLAAGLRLTPNAVTGFSVGLAALAAVWFSAGTREARIAGAVLLYLSFVLDCVDGQLARYTRAFSPLGSWLDATFDRVKEYAVYAGLAAGYAAGALGGAVGGAPGDVLGSAAGGAAGEAARAAAGREIWALAVAALILQVLRHMADSAYSGARADAAARAAAGRTGWGARMGADRPLVPAQAPPTDPSGEAGGNTGGGTDGGADGETGAGRGGGPDAGRAAGGVAGLSRRLERGAFTRRLKRMIVLPIGERMALIAVTAAVFDARVTFLALLAWGGPATLYMLGGRMGRSMA
ncbi:CDP-alcohol phosphatidyltransferase family protein [Planomonospora sp. ID82291]|uniref:CDP-alcohol phosphatidyltransferase family protein n=1 Tax=Planomonospora sp. ID82291 TaxID=2738136 RepID=UPI001A3081FE|nr:CDP-alcohol phosphatidyltransferase family protein [Planomonospora sp. ID82291]MBG0813375.1 CDP-alcohol phosphatidyltransferase family protein [Planomonospora sp. ID82291]